MNKPKKLLLTILSYLIIQPINAFAILLPSYKCENCNDKIHEGIGFNMWHYSHIFYFLAAITFLFIFFKAIDEHAKFRQIKIVKNKPIIFAMFCFVFYGYVMPIYAQKSIQKSLVGSHTYNNKKVTFIIKDNQLIYENDNTEMEFIYGTYRNKHNHFYINQENGNNYIVFPDTIKEEWITHNISKSYIPVYKLTKN